MRRNLLLILALIVSLLLGISSAKRILALRTTSQRVAEARAQLDKLREENTKLKNELEHARSREFAEAEIRNKLGFAREGEVVVIVPKDEENQKQEAGNSEQEDNWQKWWDLFFGGRLSRQFLIEFFVLLTQNS